MGKLEAKSHLMLGKSQSLDFDVQVADTTISMLQYNILSLAKRFLDYESMGEMFKQAGKETSGINNCGENMGLSY